MHKKAPFRGRRMGDVKNKIKKQKISFKKDIDPEIQKLIIQMLQVDPNKRPTVNQILNSPFIQQINQSIDDQFFSNPSPYPVTDSSNRLTRKKNIRYGVSKNESILEQSILITFEYIFKKIIKLP